MRYETNITDWAQPNQQTSRSGSSEETLSLITLKSHLSCLFYFYCVPQCCANNYAGFSPLVVITSNLIHGGDNLEVIWLMDKMIWEKDNFKVSTEKVLVNIDILHDMLSRSYWAKNRSREDVEKSIANSLCFSLLKDEEQIGFARVLTDAMAYAIILDMIIREKFRGQGIGKWLMQCICDHPEVAPLRQVLWTGDADNFYRKGGFEEMSKLKFMARNWKI